MKKLLFILSFFLFVNSAFAQNNYVRTTHNDTVFLVNITGADSFALPSFNQSGYPFIQTTVNGHKLNSNVTVTAGDVGLGNLSNNAQLTIANNLSDVNNAGTARTNLGLGTLATQNGTASNYVDKTASNTYTPGMKQIFSGNGTNAGVNFAGVSSDPSSLSNGDLWHNTTSNTFKYRVNGTTRTVANLDEAQTITGDKTFNGNIILSGNQIASSWNTSGLRLRTVPARLTDNTSSGTVPVGHTYKFSADTIAATNATTFTDYNNVKFTLPVAGTNVTITNPWAAFADNFKVGITNPLKISTAGILSATNSIFTTPDCGTPSALVATNVTGTASGLTAGNVTTNANLTGPVTSVGNATTIAASSVTNAMLAGSIDLTTKVTGILPSGNLPATVVYTGQANTYNTGMKQTFSGNATNAGINFSGISSDPSALSNGDVWHNTTSNILKYRINGTTRSVANLDEAQTFTNKSISGSQITSAVANVTTNANLTGPVTSTGNATAIANGAITNVMLAGSIAASKLIATDITTVGPITAGTWNGTEIPDSKANIWSTLGGLIKGEPIAGDLTKINGTVALGSQSLKITAINLSKGQTLTGVKWFQNVLGVYTSSNENRVGLYTLSAGTLTLVASSTNDGTLWSTAASNTWGNKAFTSTFVAAAGTYYIGAVFSASSTTTNPSLGTLPSVLNAAIFTADFTNSVKLYASLASQTSLPASITMSSLTVSATPIYLAVY